MGFRALKKSNTLWKKTLISGVRLGRGSQIIHPKVFWILQLMRYESVYYNLYASKCLYTVCRHLLAYRNYRKLVKCKYSNTYMLTLENMQQNLWNHYPVRNNRYICILFGFLGSNIV